MAKKQAKNPIAGQVAQNISPAKPGETQKKQSFHLEIPALPALTPYLPGILLFFIALIISLLTFKDYGIGWDETLQRAGGLLSYNYVFHGNQDLLHDDYAKRGFYNFIPVGYELVLVIFEKLTGLTDSRDIYLLRHILTNILFLISAFSLYVLAYRLYKNKFIACLGFIMLAFAPRLYAHSFVNSKDLPFLSIVVIILTICQMAFDKDKPALFFLLGSLCGYATSIRTLGLMFGIFILLYLCIDLIINMINKEKIKKTFFNILVFSVGFCFLLFIAWPYLWHDPINNFVGSFKAFAHFGNAGYFKILFNGDIYNGENLPWTYVPTWFLISNPEVWLMAGFAGITWTSINFFKRPLAYLKNTPERNFLLYLMCFFAPVLSVIFLHSVVYNDWRHLYFVYPSFILLALYFINKIYDGKYRWAVQLVCGAQVVLIGYFMIRNHPFNQVYFNNFISHSPEYLHKNYDLEYWGCSYKQGLQYLLDADQSKKIKINCKYRILLENNILLLPAEERGRIQFAEIESADHYISNFFGELHSYPFNTVEYSITVLNSAILCIYKVGKDAASQKQYRDYKLTSLKQAISDNPQNYDAYSKTGNVYFVSAQYDSAETYVRQALTLNPDNIDLINNLAAIYGIEGKFPLAIDLYKHAIKTYPEKVLPYTNTGLSYIYLGKYDSAIYYLKKAISVDPDFNPSFENLASAYNGAGNSDSAKKYEMIARKKNPGFKL